MEISGGSGFEGEEERKAMTIQGQQTGRRGFGTCGWATVGGSPLLQVGEQRREGRMAGSGEGPWIQDSVCPASPHRPPGSVLGYCFVLFCFLPHCLACGILVPRPGIEPGSPVSTAVEAQSPNHWTTREFPVLGF